MIWQTSKEQRATRGQQGHQVTIGSTHGLIGFEEAESCFLAISKGDLRIKNLLNSLLPLYSPNI
jgi:hypothetical protein